MIGYVCKYTPVEMIEAMGGKTVRIEPESADFNCAECVMHANICSYAKGVYETVKLKNMKKIVLMNCCDSIRRLYDTLLKYEKLEYLYMIDLPKKRDLTSKKYFRFQIEKFLHDYQKKFGAEFESENLKKEIAKNVEISQPAKNSGISVAVAGARVSKEIIRILAEMKIGIAQNITCTGEKRKFHIDGDSGIFDSYCRQLLDLTPCMRMQDNAERMEILNSPDIDGIIFQTVKFCDFYGYEYARLLRDISKPILKLESDCISGSAGQLMTRLKAFKESLSVKKGVVDMYGEEPNHASSLNSGKRRKLKKDKKTDRIVAGIDIGSTSANVALMDVMGKLIAYSIVRTGAKSEIGANDAMKTALANADLSFEDVDYVVATGYGRDSIDFADESVTEITCHGKGAVFSNPAVRTVIDIGGQDSKVIKLDGNGNVRDFVMNDKCAAGTGKFLEMMSRTLEIDIEHLGGEALKSQKNVNISSMCTVFAESEVISLIADNTEKSDIINGLCNSIASRTSSLLNRVGKEEKVMMSGGVAKNKGVVKSMESKLQTKIFLPEEPQIIGAIGAAVIGIERIKSL